jgi:hypothetical protein
MIFIKVQTPSLEMIISTCYLDVWNVEEARHRHKLPFSQFGNRNHVKMFFHGFILFAHECCMFKTCLMQIIR